MMVAERMDALGGNPRMLRVVVDGYQVGLEGLCADRESLNQIPVNTGAEFRKGARGDPAIVIGKKESTAETGEALFL